MNQARSSLSRRDFLKLSGTFAAAAAAAAACAPAVETAQVPSGPTTSAPVEPLKPAQPGELPSLGIIALNRLAFGPRPGDLEAFEALGDTDDERLRAYVDQQLNPDAIDDSDFEARYEAAGFTTLHKTLEELYADHIASNEYDANDDAYWDWYSLPAYELVDATFLRATHSRKQLTELLADFWHNHFNVYFWQDDGVPLLASYERDALRAHMLGNFREMLEAVGTHPSMLYYLNQNNSTDSGPNENYARELFELHTLGAANYLGVRDPNSVEKNADGFAIGYVDNDVYEAARCLTGWRVDDDLGEWEDDVAKTGRFLYYKPWHDRFNKLVLGRYIPADQPDMQDSRDVLDALAFHPGTARHIASKLARRLISDTPPDSVVQVAADAFSANRHAPDQLKKVVEAIVLSEEFRTTWGQKMKRPFEVTVAMMRALDSEYTRLPNGVSWMCNQMGQPLFERRPPDGYPDTQEAWANTMSVLHRWNLAVGLVENWMDDEEAKLTIRTDVHAQTPANLRTAGALADFWIARLLGRSLSENARVAVIDFMRQEYAADEELPEDHISFWLPSTVEVILMSPEFSMR